MTHSLTRSLAALAVLAASSLAGSGAASAQASVKLVLDYAVQGQQSPIVLAADGGYFSRAGVTVQVDRGYGSADAIAKVASGTYDMAFADFGALLQFNGKQGGTKLINVLQIYDLAPMVILSMKKTGITKPSDLAGKRIASPPAASSRVMFPTFAAANKIDTSKIAWLDVTPQLRETLLMQGQADATTAFFTDLPGLARLNIGEDQINIMPYSKFGVDLYGHAILTTPEFAAKNPDTVKKVVKGIIEALKASIADPSAPIAAIKKRDALVDEKVERHRLELVIKNSILTPHIKSAGLGTIENDRMKKTIQIVADTFKIPVVEPNSVAVTDYLPPVAERKVP